MAKKGKVKKIKPSKKPRISAAWIYVILLVFAVGIYANTLGHDYVLDDAILITENAYTKKGVAGLKDIFSHDTFHGFFQKEGKDQLVTGGRYRPLSQAIFAVYYSLFGLNPLVGHLSNILLYALLVCSLFFVIRHFTSISFPLGMSQHFAAVAALLFAAHPVHTEVVANIKGLDEILVLLFGIWSLYFAHLSMSRKNVRASIASGILFFLALLSKENALAFLGVIPLTLFMFT
ncbi:MAG: hypothetical protein HKN76_21090 [Saprospiraceae bacterium]|nr:hypothetical protein [Saprospiraceae bacterium]